MAAARTWRWVPAFPIRQSVPASFRVRLRGIVAENPMRFVPNRCLAGCITNTPSQLPAFDRVFADHRYSSIAGYQICARAAPADGAFILPVRRQYNGKCRFIIKNPQHVHCPAEGFSGSCSWTCAHLSRHLPTATDSPGTHPIPEHLHLESRCSPCFADKIPHHPVLYWRGRAPTIG